MKKDQIHLINYSGPKIRHWKIELVEGEDSYTISFGTDLNKLKTSIKKCTSGAYLKYHSEIYKKLGEGFMYRNTAPSGDPYELLYLLREPNKGNTRVFDIHPNGKQLVMGSQKWGSKGAEIHVLDLESGVLTLLYSVDGRYLRIHSVHFNAAGDKIFFLLQTAVKILDINTGEVTDFAEYQESMNGPNPHYVSPVFNVPRNRYLYFSEGAVNVCDEHLKPVFGLRLAFDSHEKQCKLACISPSGRLLALHYTRHGILDSEQISHIDIWDIDNNELINSIEVDRLDIHKMGFNPSETEIVFIRFAALGPGFYDIKTGKLIRWFKDSYEGSWANRFDFAYSPNGKLLAAGHFLLDAKLEKYLLTPDYYANAKPWKVMFSADSKYCIEGGDAGKILIRHAAPIDAGRPFKDVQTAEQ